MLLNLFDLLWNILLKEWAEGWFNLFAFGALPQL